MEKIRSNIENLLMSLPADECILCGSQKNLWPLGLCEECGRILTPIKGCDSLVTLRDISKIESPVSISIGGAEITFSVTWYRGFDGRKRCGYERVNITTPIVKRVWAGRNAWALMNLLPQEVRSILLKKIRGREVKI